MSLPPRQVRPGSTGRVASPSPATAQASAPDWEGLAISAVRNGAADLMKYRFTRPSALGSLVPVVGPIREGLADLQDGNYGSAAFNGAMAAADLFPVGEVVKLGRIVKILNEVKRSQPPLPSARQMRYLYEKAGLIVKGQELHHTVPLKEWSSLPVLKSLLPRVERNVPGQLRNHPAFLKVMDPLKHGSAHRGNLAEQVWHRSNALQKSVGAGIVAKGLDAEEAFGSPLLPPPKPRR
jgi:hypothetical protein